MGGGAEQNDESDARESAEDARPRAGADALVPDGGRQQRGHDGSAGEEQAGGAGAGLREAEDEEVLVDDVGQDAEGEDTQAIAARGPYDAAAGERDEDDDCSERKAQRVERER